MMLKPNMPYMDDEEGLKVPPGLPPIIDSHVHIFPSTIFSAVWKWFDKYAWHIRYQMTSTQVMEFLLSRGIKHIIALQYAHKPGIANMLNAYMAEKMQQFPHRVTGMATVFPGEENAERILQEAFDVGLGGVKLHVHVQCFHMNDEYMDPLYDCCQHNKKPIVIHAGREPKSSEYECDPHQLCGVDMVENILKTFPKLKICVPHLGFDEVCEYKNLLDRYDNLWLDTAMVLTDYFSENCTISLDRYRADRIMYGSDFPNIPYAWDREIKALKETDISTDTLEKVTYKNAAEFFGIHVEDK